MASTTLTNTTISETYVSLLHSNGEILPATGQEWIYDGCGNKSSIKLGRACNGLTVCGTLSCENLISDSYSDLIDLLYPVGSVLFSADNVNPGARFSGTTWEGIAQGRFIAGVGHGTDKNLNTLTIAASSNNDTVGEYTHQLSINEMPAHNHKLDYSGGDRCDGWGCYNNSRPIVPQFGSGQGGYRESDTLKTTGGNQAHNNIPPYFGLYVWKRTA